MHLHVFDLDHTLLTVNSSFRFGLFLYRRGHFSLRTLILCLTDYVRHKWLRMSIQSLHAQSFSRLFYQRSFEDISRHVEDFLDESLIAMLYQPVIERLQSAQQKGDSILILSSSPDFLVKAIAHRLGVQEWQATLYQVDEGGKFQTIAYVMGGEEKAKYVREFVCCKGLSLANTTIYSDSYLDLPVLNIAGRPVGVVPDKSLKEVCLQKGWEIL